MVFLTSRRITKAVFQAVSFSAVALRGGRISKADNEQFLISLNELSVRLDEPASYDDLFLLAQEHGLPVCDAAHLNIAMQERIPLASLDAQLVPAAQTAGVPLFNP
jgi:predicted nucleic acid-binding protein